MDVRADAIRRIQVIYRKAKELLEERGIRAGYLAIGMARWDELFLQPAAPVLLRGLTITPTRARHDDFELVLDDEPEVNPVLLHKLASVYGAATEKLPDLRGDRLYRMLTAAAHAAEVPGFAILDRTVIGTFTYAKLPMVRDIQNAAELLTDSDVVAAIAGDPEAQELLAADDDATPLLDSPDADYSVLDADSSQRSAIAAVLSGRSLVIHGPPGTGKSQTIANLTAALVARGQKGAVRRREAGRYRRGPVPAQGRRPRRAGARHPRGHQGPSADRRRSRHQPGHRTADRQARRHQPAAQAEPSGSGGSTTTSPRCMSRTRRGG